MRLTANAGGRSMLWLWKDCMAVFTIAVVAARVRTQGTAALLVDVELGSGLLCCRIIRVASSH